MKYFSRKLYNSKAWKRTRAEYYKSVGGLCEICFREGLIVPGEIVHHKIHLTPENVSIPEIALDWKNLQLVCRECHMKIHEDEITRRDKKRYTVGEDGHIAPR